MTKIRFLRVQYQYLAVSTGSFWGPATGNFQDRAPHGATYAENIPQGSVNAVTFVECPGTGDRPSLSPTLINQRDDIITGPHSHQADTFLLHLRM